MGRGGGSPPSIHSYTVCTCTNRLCYFPSSLQLIGPLASNETLVVADFQMLHQFEMNTHATVVMERVGEVEVGGVTPDDDTADFRSDLVMKIASLLRSEPSRRRIKEPQLSQEHRCSRGQSLTPRVFSFVAMLSNVHVQNTCCKPGNQAE